MGLDMYLYEKVFCSPYTNVGLFNSLVDATGNGDKEQYNSDGFKQPRTLEYEVGYWRKANAIHKWFVDNVQNGVDDCGEYAVEEHELRELRALCEQVISGVREPTDVLPPTSGFFFGGTEIDDWYMDDLRSTIKIIDDALENREKCSSFIYSSSW